MRVIDVAAVRAKTEVLKVRHAACMERFLDGEVTQALLAEVTALGVEVEENAADLLEYLNHLTAKRS